MNCKFCKPYIGFNNNILDHTLNQYSLKMKDMKRILKILNKRERVSFPVSTQSTHSTVL